MEETQTSGDCFKECSPIQQKRPGEDTQHGLSPIQQKRSELEPSCVSMKSDEPKTLKSGDTWPGLSPVQQKRSEPSCVSMKSDVSMTDPIISKSEDTRHGLGTIQQKRSEPEPSCVSMKSDVSMTDPIKFSHEDTQPGLSPVQQKRSEPEPSCVSMESDVSMTDPIISKSEDTQDGLRTIQQKRSEPEPSCVSMKSDVSMTDPIKFSHEDTKPGLSPVQQKRSEPEPSCVSMNSDVSMTDPIKFSHEDTQPGLSVDHGGESRITAGLQKCACFLTLDPKTAHTDLIVSEENRNVTGGRKKQQHTDHPDRFDVYPQVLCRESVCGRCYWEIEWSGRVFISLSYKSISRKGAGDECRFGRNDQSWSLFCSSSSYSFIHNNIETVLPVEPIRTRIGVFVDPSAGTLSFYSISDTMRHLYTVQTTFTQPLYPGFNVNFLSSVKLC